MKLDPIIPGRHVRRAYWAAAVGFACFTVYGSLVPFDYHARPFEEAWDAFCWVLSNRRGIQSRSDWLANCLLGFPVGFCLMGAFRVRFLPGPLDWVAALGAVTLTTLLALLVEFAQLHFPGRTCSANDILAQGLGGAAGAMAWIAAGRRLTQFARQAWADPRSGGATGQLLLGYLLLVFVVQTLPLDILTSPADVYRRLRDGTSDGRITLMPGGEITFATAGENLQQGLELIGLFLPVGLIGAQLPGTRAWSRGRVFAAGLGLAFLTELAQVVVSRHPSTTDVIWGGLGVLAGFRAGHARRSAWPWQAVIWAAILIATHWQPFRFTLDAHAVSWVPFADAQAQNYIGALDNILERMIMFVPVGVLAVRAGGGSVAAAATGCFAAGVLELGQLFLPDRDAATTELVTGTVAAVAGAVAARKFAWPRDRA